MAKMDRMDIMDGMDGAVRPCLMNKESENMNMRRYLLLVSLCGMILLMRAGANASGSTSALTTVSPAACMPRATDYTFMSWADDWRASLAGGRRFMVFRTGTWGMAFDMERVQIMNLGWLEGARPYAEAAGEGSEAIFRLPEAQLLAVVTVNGKTYRCVRGGDIGKDDSQGWRKRFPFRLIESGRWLQRCDIQGLVFENEQKERLNAEGRLEIAAWPDRVSFLLELTPREELKGAKVELKLQRTGRGENASITGDLKKGETIQVAVHAFPGNAPAAPDIVFPTELVSARDADTSAPAKVELNPIHGWQRIELPAKNWNPAQDHNHLDRVKVQIKNTEDGERVFRLLFAMDRSFPGVTGLTPMLRDAAGDPTGIPVQISKNWHRWENERLLYEGPWFHGFTMVRVPARSALDLEFDLTYGMWGGVPAASHAQLCLIGWGGNQRWDQAAIGSWGESICYDPDMAQNRSMIDDVRPLMVTSLAPGRESKWGWTNNVGGGDFLVYFNERNERQYLAGMQAAYRQYGPNLTGVTYAGRTADGRIAARIDVASPRCDDVNRAFHHFRYDVLQQTSFSRLAFYQVGADRYNDHQFEKMARGNTAGLIEEWAPEKGGLKYLRQGIRCGGEAPWFSLHEGHSGREAKGAWANRGLIVRSWKARLGGKDVPEPVAAVFGTNNGFPSANVELGPPAGLTELLPGDFVEAEVELVIVPQSAADYYGPNENLREALKAGGNTWRPVLRLAQGNRLEVKALRGRVVKAYPIEVEVDGSGGAEVEVRGGVGFVPVTFRGLKEYRGGKLWMSVDGKRVEVNQAVHGNDFWQTDWDPERRTWSRTYNVKLDAPGDARRTVRLEWGAR